MAQVLCKFVVQSAEYAGKRKPYNYINGKVGDEEDVWHVKMTPYMPQEPDDPNLSFFEATPSGDIQFYNVMHFAPKPGTTVDVLLIVPDDVPLQQEPPVTE